MSGAPKPNGGLLLDKRPLPPHAQLDRAQIQRNLIKAEERVAHGARNVREQHEIVARLRDRGHDTRIARELLQVFEDVQASHVAYRDRVSALWDLEGEVPRDNERTHRALLLRSRSEIEALCIGALQLVPSYRHVVSVRVVEEAKTSEGSTWQVAAIVPRPAPDELRAGEAELAIAPLQERYRLSASL